MSNRFLRYADLRLNQRSQGRNIEAVGASRAFDKASSAEFGDARRHRYPGRADQRGQLVVRQVGLEVEPASLFGLAVTLRLLDERAD